MKEYCIYKNANMYRSDLDRWWVDEREILPSGTNIYCSIAGPYKNEETAEEVLRLIMLNGVMEGLKK